MRLLYISEIVGKCGIQTVKACLPKLKRELKPNFVIANGNSVTGSGGLGRQHAGLLHKLGVQCLTVGDNAFLHAEIFEGKPLGYCLRPFNLDKDQLGSGIKFFQSRYNENELEGFSLVVVVLAGRFGRSRLLPNSPFDAIDSVLGKGSNQNRVVQSTKQKLNILENEVQQKACDTLDLTNFALHNIPIIVEYQAFSTAEKQGLFYYLDGKVSAVIGSGTRVASGDETCSKKGTAYISDAGRTGSSLSCGGYAYENKLREYKTGLQEYAACAWQEPLLQGLCIDIDSNCKATSIKRISIKPDGNISENN